MVSRLDEVWESPHVEQLATGLRFTEGPVWHLDGYLCFTNAPRVLMLRPATGTVEVVRDDADGPNGMTLDLQGRLVVCEGSARKVTRMGPGRVIRTLADRCEGKRLNKPNDVVGGSGGTLYFTDPGAWENDVSDRDEDRNLVYRVTPDGEVIASAAFEYPNGLAFSPDERTLYVSNTRHFKHIGAFDVHPDGSLSNGRVFADLSSDEPGVPDGMKVDVEGRVFCAGPGGLWVFAPSGQHLGTIGLPELPANCAWGGEENRMLFITARTSVYRMTMRTPGTPIPRAAE